MTHATLIQISDTHFAPHMPEFTANWEAALAQIERLRPHLVIHTGDLGCDDPDDDAARSEALRQMRRLTCRWRAIPGNHDVGDGPPDPVLGQAVTSSRCAHYQRAFGDMWWSETVGAWLLVAINGQLLAGGLPEEAAQWAFLEETLATADGPPVVLATHKPFFLHHQDEDLSSSRLTPLAARQRLARLPGAARIKRIISGHCHEFRRYGGSPGAVWAPSLSFTLAGGTPGTALEQRTTVGFVRHIFAGDTHRCELVEPQGLVCHPSALFHARRIGARDPQPQAPASPD